MLSYNDNGEYFIQQAFPVRQAPRPRVARLSHLLQGTHGGLAPLPLLRRQNLIRRQEASAVVTHLAHGVIQRALRVDGARRIFNDEPFQPLPLPGDRRTADAEVCRQSGQVNLTDAPLAQVAGKPGRRLMVVLIERGIRVDVLPKSLADDELRFLRPKLAEKLSALRTLHAMVGPQHLPPVWISITS